jgi:LemA protein
MKQSTLLLIGAAVLIFFYGGCKYNGMVKTNVAVNKQWSNVETQYQARLNLIPNLLETVKAEANFEKSVLESVIQARASATQIKVSPNDLNPENIKKIQESQGQLGFAMSRLMSVAEQYPSLKSNAAFGDLRVAVEGCERRIANEMRTYNGSVESHNINVLSFPSNIFAGMFGFKERGMFQAEKGAEKAPSFEGKFDPKPVQ